ncbi:MAG: late competence development ComFB family protein [Clostridiales bacterium]|nr:late competence development ComFB family protein [Clostridiales bacterium]
MSLILRNLMEDVVIKQLDELIEVFGGCQCELCRLDIASYALNRLPAKYVVTTQGELLSKLDSLDLQFEANITTAVTQGILLVNKNPRHAVTKTEEI